MYPYFFIVKSCCSQGMVGRTCLWWRSSHMLWGSSQLLQKAVGSFTQLRWLDCHKNISYVKYFIHSVCDSVIVFVFVFVFVFLFHNPCKRPSAHSNNWGDHIITRVPALRFGSFDLRHFQRPINRLRITMGKLKEKDFLNLFFGFWIFCTTDAEKCVENWFPIETDNPKMPAQTAVPAASQTENFLLRWLN